MPFCVYKLLLFLSDVVINFTCGTIDINLSEYQYLANHLTEKECHQLVASLHFHNFEFPKDVNAAEIRLPRDVPCIDLLRHWNSSPREGRGQTHVEVCHRLNQIGREDLAAWLSKTVFHQISKDLNVALTAATEETTYIPSNITEVVLTEQTLNEADWWKIDSVLEALTICGFIVTVCGSMYICILCCLRKPKSPEGYVKLSSNDD